MRTEREVRDMMGDAYDWVENGRSCVSGMTYEEGVAEALSWALGSIEDPPIETKYGEEEDDE